MESAITFPTTGKIRTSLRAIAERIGFDRERKREEGAKENEAGVMEKE